MFERILTKYLNRKLGDNLKQLELQLQVAKLTIALKDIRETLLSRAPKIGGEPFPPDEDIYLINKINNHLKEKEKAI